MKYIFGSDLRQKVLGHFIQNPTTPFHVRELATTLGFNAGNISKELSKLIRADFLISQKSGKYKVYTLNLSHQLFKEIRALSEKTFSTYYNSSTTLKSGEAIDGTLVQFACSPWGAKKLTTLCNAIILGTIISETKDLPSFTDRVNVADDGKDAELIIDITKEVAENPNPFLREGINVFQYKQRDATTNVSKQISTLTSSLQGELNKVCEKAGNPVNNYILFTNIDLRTSQKKAIEQNILKDYPDLSKVKVSVIGGADIASFLNNMPHIRSSFFVSASFLTWNSYYEKEKRQELLPWVEMIGRTDLMTKLQDLLADQNIKVVLTYGPHGIGKKRLILESTKSCSWSTVFITDPQHMCSAGIRSLSSTIIKNTVVIVSDPEADKVEEMIREALSMNNITLIIALPSTEMNMLSGFGHTSKVVHLPIPPLSRDESEKLIQSTGKRMDFSLLSWTIHHSDGNPLILLAAANLQESLKEMPDDFVHMVGSDMSDKITKSLGKEALDVLRLISILTNVGIDDYVSGEIHLISKFLGNKLPTSTIYTQIDRLKKAGLVRVKGSYVEVTPPILATHLAQQLLRRSEHLILLLFSQLSDNGRTRFLERLGLLKSDHVSKFWDEVFASNGPFKDLNSLKKNIKMLHTISGAVPERTGAILEREILTLPAGERSKIADDFRRDIMWTLQELLFRQKTSILALRIIGSLAEAENETWGNNATGVFSEAFHPRHSQMPSSLEDRLTILQAFTKPDAPRNAKLLAVKAINSATRRHGSFSLHASTGLKPLEGVPTMTWGMLWNYLDALSNLLMELSRDEDMVVAKSACQELPHVISECIIQGTDEKGIEKFKTVTEFALESDRIDISSLAQSLNFTIEVLNNRIKEKEIPEDRKTENKQWVIELGEIKESIDTGSFALKIKRWAGRWTRDDHDPNYKEKYGTYRFLEELKTLAEEAIANTGYLTNSLLEWLSGPDANKAYVFLLHLGELDTKLIWLEKFEQLAKTESGAYLFGLYCGGAQIHSSSTIESNLDRLHKDNKIHPYAVLYATSQLGGNAKGVERVVELITENGLDPVFAEKSLVGGRWIDSLDPKSFLIFLKAIAGSNFKNTGAVINMLGMWLHLGKDLDEHLTDFVWECFEAATPIHNNQTWHHDHLANVVVQKDIERGFALAEKLILIKDDEKHWNPIDRFSSRTFWESLRSADPRRALLLLLNTCMLSSLHKHNIIWNLQESLNQTQDKDLIIALSLEDRNYAEMLSNCISTKKEDFWPVALPIIDYYMDDNLILSNIQSGIEQVGFVRMGEQSVHLKKCYTEIEQVLQTTALSPKTKLWLQKIIEKYKRASESSKIEEENEGVDNYSHYRPYVESNDNNLREWAICKALETPFWEEVIDHVRHEDLPSILTQHPFTEKRKNEIKRRVGLD